MSAIELSTTMTTGMMGRRRMGGRHNPHQPTMPKLAPELPSMNHLAGGQKCHSLLYHVNHTGEHTQDYSHWIHLHDMRL